MSEISVIWQGRFAGTVAPSTGKIMKNGLEFLERKDLVLGKASWRQYYDSFLRARKLVKT